MKKLCVIFCLVILFVGCGLRVNNTTVNDVHSTEAGENDIDKDENESCQVDEQGLIELYNGHPSSIFLFSNDWYMYNGWIHYSTINGSFMCKYDLSQNKRDINGDSDIHWGQATPEGYRVGWKPLTNKSPSKFEWFLFSSLDNIVEELVLPSQSSDVAGITLYNGMMFIVYSEDDRRTDMFTLDGSFERTVTPEWILSRGFVDDYLYFYAVPSEDEASGTSPADIQKIITIMRYDISNDTMEVFLEVERSPEEWRWGWKSGPVYYNNRNIIVQKGLRSFVYTNIDDATPKEIKFEHGLDNDVVSYISSNDENLYFMYYNSDINDNTEGLYYGFTEYYSVEQGTVEPIKLKRFECQNPMFFSDGFLYYQNDNNELLREKML